MNILVLPAWFPTAENPHYGVFAREHSRAAALYDNVVIAYGEGGGAGDRISGAWRIQSDRVEQGVRTVRFLYHPVRLRGTGLVHTILGVHGVVGWLVRNGFRADVFHAHVFSAGLVTALVGKWLGVPVVITEHATAFPRRALSLKDRLFARVAMRLADKVLPVSQALQRAIEDHGIQGDFRVIPNTVDTDLFLPSGTNSQSGIARPSRILSVGALTPRKGWTLLLRALHALRERQGEFRLDIVGDGPNQAEYEQLSVELGLGGVVHFCGVMGRRALARQVQECDFFVLPSLQETFSVVLIEALACGKPVVATRCGGPEEIVTDEVGILVPRGNVVALASAIGTMLDQHEQYDASGIANYARQRYSYEVIGSQLHEIYARTLSRKRG